MMRFDGGDGGYGPGQMSKFQRRKAGMGRMLPPTPGAGMGVNMGRVGRPPEAAPFDPGAGMGAATDVMARGGRPDPTKLPMPSLPPWIGGAPMGRTAAFDRSTMPVAGPDGGPEQLPSDQNDLSRQFDLQKLPMPAFPGMGQRPMRPWDRRGPEGQSY